MTTELLSPEFLRKLEQLELSSRKILAGRLKGERRSKRRGSSVEFADHREYVVGDDLRFIDWNIMIRLDRLFLKLFEEEEDLHFHVLIDTSASMEFGTPTKLHYAKQVAAALAFVGLVNRDRVHLAGIGPDLIAETRPLRGRTNVLRAVEFLENLQPSPGTNLTQSLRTFSLKHAHKAVVVLLSDMLDKEGYEKGLRYLVSARMDVYAIQILAAEEVNPDLAGDLSLIDCEDNDVAEVTVSAPLLARYRANLAAYQRQLKEYCTRRGVTYVATTNQAPFDRLVLSYLRERGLLQ